MAYQAWGECVHCGFVGDMWFSNEPVKDVGVIVMAQCPKCACETNLDEMKDYPSAD